MMPGVSLPFTWKWNDAQDVSRSHQRVCMSCGKGVRGANALASVACDFCSVVYHLDCLDPPLTEVPRETWMCPNHVESLLDSRLVSSTRLTHRLNVWDRFAHAPIDVESVKLDFFRKARKGRLAASCRIRIPNHRRVKVPGFVKAQYRNRQPKLSSSTPPTNRLRKKPLSDREERDEFLKSLVAMQTSILETDMRKESALRSTASYENNKNHDDNGSDTDSDCNLDLESSSEARLNESTEIALRLYLAKVRRSSMNVRQLPSVLRDLLAQQRLAELWPSNDVSKQHEVRARAALIPLNKTRMPFLMRYRTIEVGMGGSSGPQRIDLSEIGWCNFVSQKHFVIYFDQLSRVYEVINYSEHGLIIDQTVYAFQRPVTSITRNSKIESVSSGRMSWNRSERSCLCSASISSIVDEGCESSAVVTHGSYIRLGCMELIFSLASTQIEEA